MNCELWGDWGEERSGRKERPFQNTECSWSRVRSRPGKLTGVVLCLAYIYINLCACVCRCLARTPAVCLSVKACAHVCFHAHFGGLTYVNMRCCAQTAGVCVSVCTLYFYPGYLCKCTCLCVYVHTCEFQACVCVLCGWIFFFLCRLPKRQRSRWPGLSQIPWRCP